jgi:hypothetical protein
VLLAEAPDPQLAARFSDKWTRALLHAWQTPLALGTHHLTLLPVWTSALAMLFAASLIVLLRSSSSAGGLDHIAGIVRHFSQRSRL